MACDTPVFCCPRQMAASTKLANLRYVVIGSPLKQQLHSYLDKPPGSGRRELAEIRRADAVVRQPPLRAVQQIENLNIELHPQLLEEAHILTDGYVFLADSKAASVAQARSGVTERARPGLDERSGAEQAMDSRVEIVVRDVVSR